MGRESNQAVVVVLLRPVYSYAVVEREAPPPDARYWHHPHHIAVLAFASHPRHFRTCGVASKSKTRQHTVDPHVGTTGLPLTAMDEQAASPEPRDPTVGTSCSGQYRPETSNNSHENSLVRNGHVEFRTDNGVVVGPAGVDGNNHSDRYKGQNRGEEEEDESGIQCRRLHEPAGTSRPREPDGAAPIITVTATRSFHIHPPGRRLRTRHSPAPRVGPIRQASHTAPQRLHWYAASNGYNWRWRLRWSS